MNKITHLTVEEGGAQNRRRIHLREISGDMDSPLETVGQELRSGRLRRGDDLATVAKALKIRKDHLEALEEDRLEALPGRTYAVGFTRTYADYLGLDTARVLERYKAQIAGRTEDPNPTITIIDDDDQRRLPQGWKIIVGVVFLLLAYGAYHLIVPAADRMLAPPVAPVPAQLTGKTESPHKAPAVSKPQTVTTAAAPTAQPQAAQNGQAPVAAPGVATSAQQQAGFPPGQVYGKQHADARVILRMKSSTHILVKGPGGTVYINRILNPGDSYMVPNIPGMTLYTENAGAVQIDLDGSAMGTAGQSGQAALGVSLDPQAIADHGNKRPG
jgi:cytoskeleton protein RodZ